MRRISSRIVIPKILRRLLDLHQDINMKSEILARFREMARSISGISFSHAYNEKKQYGMRSRVEENAVRIRFMEELLQKDVKELSGLTEKFYVILGKIEDVRCRELLTYRYLCGNTWEQVAERMNYSFIHVSNRLHPKALKLLDELILYDD